MLDAIEWDHSDADIIIYSDASLTGLGFTAPSKLIGFCASVPNDEPVSTIFYFEALAIASAILWASGITPPICHLLLYTDSLNCMEIFNSLHMLTGYNNILLLTVHILISMNISLWVFHIPGLDNMVANTLSHHFPNTTSALSPGLHINLFNPPHYVLGWPE